MACDPRIVSFEPAPGKVRLSDVVLGAYWSCKPAPITSPANGAFAKLGRLLPVTFLFGAATITSLLEAFPVTKTALGPLPPAKMTGALLLPLAVRLRVSLPLP